MLKRIADFGFRIWGVLAPPLICLFLLTPAFGQYDLLLKGGHVIDPRNNIDARRDVAIQAGKIAEVAATIDPARARKTIDAGGLYVTPGLVDIHTHLFHTTGIRDAWAGDNSVQPDAFSFRSGVTTMVDAGSSGWRNFEAFRHSVIDRVRTRVLALINIAGLGMMADVTEQVAGDFHAGADDLGRAQVGVGQQGAGGRQGVAAAGADTRDAVGRLDDVAGAAEHQEVVAVDGDHHRL